MLLIQEVMLAMGKSVIDNEVVRRQKGVLKYLDALDLINKCVNKNMQQRVLAAMLEYKEDGTQELHDKILVSRMKRSAAVDKKVELKVVGDEISNKERHAVWSNMIASGEAFVSRLGEALVYADEIDTRRIKEAFPGRWEKYLNMGGTT